MTPNEHIPEDLIDQEQQARVVPGAQYGGIISPSIGILAVGAWYQAPDEDAVGGELRQVYECRTGDEAYRRKLRLTPHWQPLDCGWVKCVAAVALYNETLPGAVNPTQAQAQERAGQAAEVFLGGNPPDEAAPALLVVPPGEALVLRPAPGVSVWLRGAGGLRTARVLVLPA